MPTTAPIFEETAPDVHSVPRELREMPGRVQRIESEMAELRETVARFAELMIGEFKDLRNSQAELPPEQAPSDTDNGIPPEVPAPAPETAPLRGPWLLMELLRDFSTTFRMYFDPRYRVRRATQMLVPLIIGLLVLNVVFFNHILDIPIISAALSKMVDIVLAILLYKVLSREIARYRLAIHQFNSWQGHVRSRRNNYYISSEPATTRVDLE